LPAAAAATTPRQPMQESEEKVICMSGVDEGALEELVRFAYCGKVTLTEETVLELLVAANRLQMPQVVEQACDFLLQRMDSSNCLVRAACHVAMLP
jgi:hypothetical protein